MNPDRPVLRGTAQNPDVFFQAREACNPFYDKCAGHHAEGDGQVRRDHRPRNTSCSNTSAPRMPSASSSSWARAARRRTRRSITSTRSGEKVGVLKVRLYRPFDVKRFIEALPATVKAIAVLDRTKEPGALGEPLYLDVVAALTEGLANGWGKLKTMPKVVGGRYGLSSKEFTPAMVKAVFDNLAAASPRTTSPSASTTTSRTPAWPTTRSSRPSRTRWCARMFYGLGSDGTVGANKNSIKIIGENTDNYAQGYFVYDSKKAGAVTISHLRFGPKPIRSTYLVSKANFVACHQPVFLERYDMLKDAGARRHVPAQHAITARTRSGTSCPRPMQESLIKKKVKFYVIDAISVAKATGMGARINTIMQTCFFALSGVLPRDEAIEQIKYTIKKTYGKKGEDVVQKNIAAVDQTLANLFEVKVPAQVTSTQRAAAAVHRRRARRTSPRRWASSTATAATILPVSAFPPDGTFPTGTAQYEKRNLALEIPVWDEKTCIQCGKCVVICPHAPSA